MALESLGLLSAGIAYSTSAEIALTMEPSKQYVLVTSSAAWLLITPTGTAAVKQAAGTHYIPAFTPVLVSAIGNANRCVIIQDTAAGWAQLSEKAYQPG